MLANAAHVKNVPGRKTDVKDADWVSDLLAHGLIRASFVPDNPTQEIRTLLRTRKQLSREKSSHILRIQKTLEDANIKIGLGDHRRHGSERAKDDRGADCWAERSRQAGALGRSPSKGITRNLARGLRGRVTKHHRFLLRLHLNQIDALDAAITKIDREVEASIAPFRTAVEQVTSIPGVKDLSARAIISEIGIDMSRFVTDAHLISWACLCPRSDESAGKRRSNRIRKGSPWLKTTLVQSAWAAARTKGSYLQAQFHRIRSRRGVKKAIVAVAASILTAIYHMLKDGTLYHDLGPTTSIPAARSGRKTALSNVWQSLGMLCSSLLYPTSAAARGRVVSL